MVLCIFKAFHTNAKFIHFSLLHEYDINKNPVYNCQNDHRELPYHIFYLFFFFFFLKTLHRYVCHAITSIPFI